MKVSIRAESLNMPQFVLTLKQRYELKLTGLIILTVTHPILLLRFFIYFNILLNLKQVMNLLYCKFMIYYTFFLVI